MIQESEENTCSGVRWLSSASVYCDDLAASPYAYMFVARDLQCGSSRESVFVVRLVGCLQLVCDS